jgi:hypothetical protein
VIVVIRKNAGGIARDNLFEIASAVGGSLASVDHVGDFLHIERGTFSFSLQIWIHLAFLISMT